MRRSKILGLLKLSLIPIICFVSACETTKTTVESPLHLFGTPPEPDTNATIGFSKSVIVTEIDGESLDLFRLSSGRVLYVAVPPGSHTHSHCAMDMGWVHRRDETTVEIEFQPGQIVFIESGKTGDALGFMKYNIREGGKAEYKPVPYRVISVEPVDSL